MNHQEHTQQLAFVGLGSIMVAELKPRVRKIIGLLKRAYPDAKCSLNHSNAFELLIATILSAQCTDARVNIVTQDLFRKYRKPEDYLKVSEKELQRDIRTTGFFRNKTKSIQGTSKALMEDYGSKVPQTMDELLELPGVARKTANVVLGNAFGIAAGVVVDTHVTRLSHRLGLSQAKDSRKDRRRPHPNCSKKRLGDLPSPADRARPGDLQGAKSSLRRMRSRETMSIILSEDGRYPWKLTAC